MAVKVWIGEEFEHTHEAKAIALFIENMKTSFDQDECVYHVLCNFFVDGYQVDVAVIKPDAIIVCELKDVGGPVFGGENGQWYVQDAQGKQELRGGRFPNPYLQARRLRAAVLDLFKRQRSEFLNKRSQFVPFNRCVTAVIAFSPVEPVKSNIKIGSGSRWFSHCGVDKLHEEIAQQRTPIICLSDEEMIRLIEKTLSLQEARLVGNTPMLPITASELTAQSVAESNVAEPLAELIPASDVEPEPPIESVSTEPETQETVLVAEKVTVVPAPFAAAERVACISCAVGAHACDVSHIKGRLLKIEPVWNALLINAEHTGEIRVLYDPAEDPAVQEMIPLMNARLQQKQPLTVAFWHLQRDENGLRMNDQSLFILEPDWLINVSDLTETVYCSRKMLIGRYDANAPGEAAILGSAVHHAFPETWKGSDFDQCMQAVEESLNSQSRSLVVSSTVPEDIMDAAQWHIKQLCAFAADKQKASVLRRETFVLSPELGLKGKIDAVWERDGRPVMVGELKTGKANYYQGKTEAKEEHKLQVAAYAFMLIARGEADPKKLKAILMYTGDTKQLCHTVVLGLERLQRVIQGRNTLVRLDFTGDAPYQTNTRKCFSCYSRLACRHVGLLESHSDPRPVQDVRAMLPAGDPLVSSEDRKLFRHYRLLLAAEFAAVKTHLSQLWQEDPETRAEAGKALALDATNPPEGVKDPGDGCYTYRLRTPAGKKNTSELRPSDRVLLSGEEGPMTGRTAFGEIVKVDADGLAVRLDEELLFSPAWADAYTDESLAERMFNGLYHFCSTSRALKSFLFDPNAKPTFSQPCIDQTGTDWFQALGSNHRQVEALERSLRADHFLLINGPPGSGKTSLIASMVQAHLAQGRRILITTFTNRALDQALGEVASVLDDKDWLRLGSPLSSADEKMRQQTIEEIVKKDGLSAAQDSLLNRPVIGATISSLLTGIYSDALGEFDLVVVDEATQATIPATLGAISFGERFILIGDPKQLAPIVQSDSVELSDVPSRSASDSSSEDFHGLHVSLFELLWERYGDVAGVALEQQYRMNDIICSIPSRVWYEPEITLRPANDAVACARLACSELWSKQPLHRLLDPSRPFVFVDVKRDPEGQRTNAHEANLVADLLMQLTAITDGIGAASDRAIKKVDAVSVAVISPYRAQVALIRRLLVERDPERTEVWTQMVDTVDRFQGSQADVVIISLSPYTDRVSEHIAHNRRLNVAMTRARHKLIVLGNRSHFEEDELFQKLFAACDELIGEDNYSEDCSAFS